MSSIERIIQAKLNDVELRDGTDVCGDEVEIQQPTVEHQLLFVPVAGVIGQNLSSMERGMGAVDTLDIYDELIEAAGDDTIKGIFLDIDSPGGTVNGTPELAEFVRAYNKPVAAFTRGMMASAAYYIGGAADVVMATPSAEVGSVGVIYPFIDSSEAYAQEGLKVDLITAGKHKGAGFDGTSLTDEQRALMQADVDLVHGEFMDFVTRTRDIAEEDMEGQTFTGNQAKENGMVDITVKSREGAINIFLNNLTNEGYFA